jgi:hypothetical protein
MMSIAIIIINIVIHVCLKAFSISRGFFLRSCSKKPTFKASVVKMSD